MEKKKEYAIAGVRIALGLLFLYFAWDKVQVPEATAAIIQGCMFASFIPSSNPFIYFIALVEALVGLLLVLGIAVKKTALLASLLLLSIILIANVPQDFVLLAVAIMLSITDSKVLCCKKLFK